MGAVSTGKMMHVNELSELWGVSSEAIKKHIRELFPEIMKNGVGTYVTEYQATYIKTKMTATTQVVANKTNLEKALLIKQAMSFQQELIDTLTAENERMKPAVEFYEAVTSSKDALDMKDVAKVLNLVIGRNNLFELLRNKSILMSNNTPYQEYVDRGYFRVIEKDWKDPEGNIHIKLKTVVYQKGLDFIRNIVLESRSKEINQMEMFKSSIRKI